MDRRDFLRGAGGAALAGPTAGAQAKFKEQHPAMQPFAAGTSAVRITPTRAELDEIKGRFVDKPLFASGEAQPLWARVLATRAGDHTLLLVAADLHSTPMWMSNEIRAALGRRCGLARDAIAICTSQNHSCPSTSEKEYSYSRRLVRELTEVGAAAVARLRPARIGAAKGYEHGLGYNSRLPITEDMLPEACPDLVRHRGGCMFARDHRLGRSGGRPVDHEVGVIRIDDAEGKPMAVIFHYGCHPATVIDGPYLHGDYAGFAAERIEKALPGATALFLQGSLGNSHPRDFFTDVDHARRNGQGLAAEVLRVLPDVRTADRVAMGFAGEPFPVTLVAYPTERLERLLGHFRAFLRELGTNPQACWIGAGPDTVNLPPRYPVDARRRMVAPLIKYCEDTLAARRNKARDDLTPLQTDIQIFRWNDIALCFNGLEMFYQTGLEIKRLSPLRYTFPVGNANTLVGYVAPQEEFDLGGYEVVTNPMYAGQPGMRSPENCPRIVQRFMVLLDRLLGS
jgi:neutral ceramidase